MKWPASSQSRSEAKGHKTYCFRIIDQNSRRVNANVCVAGRDIVITFDFGVGHDQNNARGVDSEEVPKNDCPFIF